MQILLLDVDSGHGAGDPGGTADRLTAAGAAGVETCSVSTPADVDAALAGLDARRLVISADLEGVNLVVSRLMRARLLDRVDTAVLPRSKIDYLHRLGLPVSSDAQLLTAVRGVARLVGVIKDDSGGVCVDHARLEPWLATGSEWWLRAVVDDQRLVDGAARSVTVRRIGPAQLEATVRTGRLRGSTLRGRSLQLACDEALVVQDGIRRERPRSKRTLWSEPALWKVAIAAG